MITQYLYIGAAVAFLAVISTTGYVAYNAGIDHEKAATARLIEQEQAKQAKLREEVERAKADRAIIYREKIKIVREASDPTGCSDNILPNDILKRLLPSSDVKTGSGFNRSDGKA